MVTKKGNYNKYRERWKKGDMLDGNIKINENKCKINK